MIVALNILIFIVVIYLQSSLLARFDVFGFVPNIVLILMLSFALFRRIYEAYIFAFLSGLVLDTISGGPFGLYTATFMLIVFVSSLLLDEDHSKISNVFANIFISVSGLIFYGTLLLYIYLQTGTLALSSIYFSFIQTVFTVVVFVLFFPILKKLFLWENKVDKLRSR